VPAVTLAEALAAAAGLGLGRLDGQLLLLHALGRGPDQRGWLLVHDTDELQDGVRSNFMRFCERRAAGEPLAYITGHREFFGLDLVVDPRVLVPRPDTETLVEWALEVIRHRPAPRVIDLGTGSGAIALAIKSQRPDARVTATDTSAGALEVAVANARALEVDIELRQMTWLAGIRGRFDLIVSNPPYIAMHDQHLAGLAHEPLSALVAGPDGLDDLRAIIGQAPAHMAASGWLLLEHGYDQAEAVCALLAGAGFHNIAGRRDLAGIARCSGGQWLELG
jgi:release factor glutamine methyltransferase